MDGATCLVSLLDDCAIAFFSFENSMMLAASGIRAAWQSSSFRMHGGCTFGCPDNGSWQMPVYLEER